MAERLARKSAKDSNEPHPRSSKSLDQVMKSVEFGKVKNFNESSGDLDEKSELRKEQRLSRLVTYNSNKVSNQMSREWKKSRKPLMVDAEA